MLLSTKVRKKREHLKLLIKVVDIYIMLFTHFLKCFTQGVVYRFHHPDGENEALRGHVT